MSDLVADDGLATTNGRAPATRTAGIASLAMSLPETVVTSAEIGDRLGVTEDWITSRSGIRARRHATEGETLTGLASDAARQALERASVEAAELDLVVVATITPDRALPAAAPMVAAEIGASRAGAMDVVAACTGFLSALSLAAAQIEAGRAEKILVIGAEVLTSLVDHDDRKTAPLFADGAGAAIVVSGGPGRIGPLVLHSDGAQADLITASHEERKIRMRGQDTFRAAVANMSEATLEAIALAGVELPDIDLFVYHQANGRILTSVGERLGLDPARVIDVIGEYGNTSAASVPIALCEAERLGLITPGSRVLVSAFGAGLVWGAGVIEWENAG